MKHLDQHLERTRCALPREPSKRTFEKTVKNLVISEDKHFTDIVSGLQCRYAQFVIGQSCGTYLPKYPVLFQVDESNNVRRNSYAVSGLKGVLIDGRRHGVDSIEIDKFFGKLIITVPMPSLRLSNINHLQ